MKYGFDSAIKNYCYSTTVRNFLCMQRGQPQPVDLNYSLKLFVPVQINDCESIL